MSRPKVIIELSVSAFYNLSDYLQDHESDIAAGKDGIDGLRELYMVIFGDNPKGWKNSVK